MAGCPAWCPSGEGRRGSGVFHELAARFNPDLKAKYQQLVAAGKPAKIAITAVMRKLIVTANALLKADRLWRPSLA
jgi:transposase